jgi:hypothetical protein
MKKIGHILLLASCMVLMVLNVSLTKGVKPEINITYDNPQLNFSCFMDALLEKTTWPSTVAGLGAVTQIGIGGCCALFGICLLKQGINTLAQSFTNTQDPISSTSTNRKGALTYLIGGSALTAAGLWLIWKNALNQANQIITGTNQ